MPMPDYQLLDLSHYLNVGIDVLGTGATSQIGRCHFRGLPFLIGDDPTKCFIVLDRDSVARQRKWDTRGDRKTQEI